MTAKHSREEMELSVESLDTVRDGILNALLIVSTIIAIPPLVASLFRIVEIGWQNIMYFHVIAYLAISITTIFRRKLIFFHKALILISFGFLIGCIATLNMGLIGSGVIFMFFSIILATMFLGVRYGGLLIIAGLAWLIIVALGVNQGWLLFDFNFETAAVALSSWVSKILSFGLFTTLLIVFLGRLVTHLVDSSNILKERTMELNWTNEKVMEEIAAKNRTEEALRRSEEKYRILAENATDVIWTTDLNLNMTYVSPSVQRFRGYSVEEVMAQRVEERLTPEFVAGVTQALTEELEMERKEGQDLFKSRTFELEFRCKDGSTKWSETKVSFVRDSDGKVMGILGVNRDITDRRKAEEALRESEEKFKEIVENIDEVIFTLDLNGEITYISPACTFLFGYVPEELMGQPASEFIYQEDMNRLENEFQSVLKGENEPSEYRVIHKNGTPHWVKSYSKPIFLGDKVIGTQGVLADINDRKIAEEERKKLENQLLQAQKMEAIGTLAGGIAHDFNNILSPIIANSEMAMMDLPPESPLHFNLQQIYKSGERARDLVKQILTFARRGKEERITLKASLILKEVITFLRSTIPSTIDIRYDMNAEPDTISADPVQINQIVMNLCTNAAHAMQEKGGLLKVDLVNRYIGPDDLIHFDGLNAGHYLKLSVSDTGEGIPENIMDNIFEPYFTTKDLGKGTGMGLAIVHGIVKSLGGDISVESEIERGTTFHVFLPIFEEQPLPDKEFKKDFPRGEERILFVDDEKSTVDAMGEILERLGYDVTTRTNSLEALEAFRHEPETFDLVITDMTMPNMTGAELARELMSIRPGIPVILCTGFSEKIDEKKSKNMGISAFIMKPIAISEIANTIRNVLDKNQAS